MRRMNHSALPLLMLITFAWPSTSRAVDTSDTSFLHEPAIGAGRIVFVYADDLWTARVDGSEVRRLTAHPGPESSPYLSPDGKLVAFNASYDGNPDVYVVPIGGGEPTRLTWHPGPDAVVGFKPDGQVLFRSPSVGLLEPLHPVLRREPQGRVADAASHPQRIPGRLLARRRACRLHPAQRAVPPVEELPRGFGVADLGHEAGRPRRRGDPPATRGVATTPIRCGWATRPISCRTEAASSTCSRMIAGRNRSSSSPATTTSRSRPRHRARGRSSTSKPGGSGSSTRRARSPSA